VAMVIMRVRDIFVDGLVRIACGPLLCSTEILVWSSRGDGKSGEAMYFLDLRDRYSGHCKNTRTSFLLPNMGLRYDCQLHNASWASETVTVLTFRAEIIGKGGLSLISRFTQMSIHRYQARFI
jgi:hypothetical protein